MIITKQKSLYLLLFFFCSSFLFSQQSQSATVSYKAIFNPKARKAAQNEKFGSSLEQEMAKNMINQALDVSGTLTFNNEMSQYSVDPGLEKSFTTINLAHVFAGGSRNHYYVKEEGKAYFDYELQNQFYLVENDPVEWIIKDEEKSIQGYRCKKAVKKNEKNKKYPTIVWYTEEIPFSYGPQKINGLPGLVVRAETASIIYTLESFAWHETPLIFETLKTENALSYEEFKTKAMNSYPDFLKN